MSFPDIESTLIKLGCAPNRTKPNDPTKPLYTLPAIVNTSSSPQVVLADSLAIAEYLDAKYPDCPVFSKKDKALEYAFEECFNAVTLQPHLFLMPFAFEILDDRSNEYHRVVFAKNRVYINPDAEANWKALEAAYDRMAAMIEKNSPDVDYFAGETSLLVLILS